MIVFDLRCRAAHVFEAWFGSSSEYEAQLARGLIACPMCGDTGIAKAVMAPAVAAKGNSRGGADPDPAALAALLTAQRALEAASDYVGDTFASVARALHGGSQPPRRVHGEATLAEARALADDGIEVMPLPFRPLARSDA